MIRVVDVDDLVATSEEPVSDDPTVTPPVDGLSTNNRRYSGLGERDQFVKCLLKLVGERVVGVCLERVVLPLIVR